MPRPATSRILDILFVTLLVGSVRSNSVSSEEDDAAPASTFTDQWAVHISGGDEVADAIAAKHGFTNLGKIFGDYYHFQHRKVAKRSIEPGTHHNDLLNSESKVRWVQQQVVKRRVKRDLLDWNEVPHDVSTRWERSRNDRGRPSRRVGSSSIRSVTYSLNDPRWAQMWYLNRGAGLDMNVQEAWAEGVTGKGTVVTILDDGLEKDHPDIRRNYDPLASYDVNNNDEDPMPRYDLVDSNRHGTRCAGEVAAEANNSICAVGIAFRAGIGGVRMLDGEVTDAVEARSLSLNPQHIDIYSASWGPDDDGKTVDGPGELAMRAFIEGVTKGRQGRGSIFVWASGNGGRDRDNCNCDGYTNSIWTLSISSATENGYVPWYSEACSSTLATTYSSGSSGEKQIVTTDLHHSCTASHTGTSASAPLAAGICALALEANPGLTWRDMQHIVVRTAKPANLKADDWQTNGVGRNVSHSFGYGLMDAAAMVRLARVWPTVPQQRYCEIRATDSNKLIPAKSQIKLQLVVRECDGVNFIEHLQARITLAAVSRGDIQIHLSSPSGTRSTLLALRPHDSSRNGFHSWPFMSVHYWGESPFGAWVLEIQNEGRYLATLSDWNVIVYGTKEAPGPKKPEPTTPATTTTAKTPVAAASAPVPGVGDAVAERPSHPPANSNRIDAAVDDEKERDASVAAVVGPQSVQTIRVAGAASSGSIHCRPGHWDAATAACLMCDSGTYLLEGKCVPSCPDAFFASNRTELTGFLDGICIPCHYTCLMCSGPNDSECLTCHPDAQFQSVNVPGPNRDKIESYCHPRELVNQLANYEKWSLGVELALALNVACLVALMVYLMCTRNNCRFSLPSFCGGGGEKSSKSGSGYQNLMSYQYQKRGSVEYSDSKSASTGIDVPAVIIENDEEELSD